MKRSKSTVQQHSRNAVAAAEARHGGKKTAMKRASAQVGTGSRGSARKAKP
jgi:hypothetical protein